MGKSFNSPAFRAGDWVIISGQTGRIGEELVSELFDDQFAQCLKNLKKILDDNSLQVASIAKVNIYLRKMSDRNAMNEIYTDFFGTHLPARTTVGVSELSRNALVEIEAWAYDKK